MRRSAQDIRPGRACQKDILTEQAKRDRLGFEERPQPKPVKRLLKLARR
jgi:hypothetical protein